MRNWLKRIGPAITRRADAAELARLRLRWRYDAEGDRYQRGEHLIDKSGGLYWLHHVSGDTRCDIIRHLPYPTLLDAMRAERYLA